MATVIRRKQNPSSTKEEMIAVGAIMSAKFLKELEILFKRHGSKIKSPYVITIVGWCYDYFSKTHKKD